MNAYSRTLPLPGAARPVRERGASALDRTVTAWPAPNPVARVTDQWAAPTGLAVVPAGVAPWPAPDPSMRVELRVPDPQGVFASVPGLSGRADLVEPRHAVPLPDLWAAARAAMSSPVEVTQRPPWPAPTLGTAAVVVPQVLVADEADRSGITTRLVIGLAVVAGALAAGAAALLSLF